MTWRRKGNTIGIGTLIRQESSMSQTLWQKCTTFLSHKTGGSYCPGHGEEMLKAEGGMEYGCDCPGDGEGIQKAE